MNVARLLLLFYLIEISARVAIFFAYAARTHVLGSVASGANSGKIYSGNMLASDLGILATKSRHLVMVSIAEIFTLEEVSWAKKIWKIL